MQIEDDTVTFSTGRTAYAHRGIIGLNDELVVSEGYDGGFWNRDDRLWAKDGLTKEEEIELADYMIALWTRFKETV